MSLSYDLTVQAAQRLLADETAQPGRALVAAMLGVILEQQDELEIARRAVAAERELARTFPS